MRERGKTIDCRADLFRLDRAGNAVDIADGPRYRFRVDRIEDFSGLVADVGEYRVGAHADAGQAGAEGTDVTGNHRKLRHHPVNVAGAGGKRLREGRGIFGRLPQFCDCLANVIRLDRAEYGFALIDNALNALGQGREPVGRAGDGIDESGDLVGIF